MNIGQAKQEIKNTVRAYLRKNEDGEYCVPVVRQRPLLLMGPPGIGKTAIMQQITDELGIGFVSYTMTHHTRQSAVGLPKILEQTYEGSTFPVTRYTMSEIIASVYDTMAQSGCREGILFLDEINCVSDTLAPTMLQFLQNKTFGTHVLPAGWIIAAAGNPPEYNRSVREFDIATLDRIRTIEIQPDTAAFLEYAAAGIHNAVVSYLKLYPDRFYHASLQEGRKYYVTARGWEDLSALLVSYEELCIPVTEELVSEFLCLPETCRGFFSYYQLYRKYDSDYSVPELLSGAFNHGQTKAELLRSADYVERFAVVQMLLHGVGQAAAQYAREDEKAVLLHEALRDVLAKGISPAAYAASRRKAAETKARFRLLSAAEIRKEAYLLKQLDTLGVQLQGKRVQTPEELRRQMKAFLAPQLQLRERRAAALQAAVSSSISWLKTALGRGQELTALLSGMTADPVIMDFIARHGCREYLEECSCLQTALAESSLRAACAAAE